jgi:hypothetical protein
MTESMTPTAQALAAEIDAYADDLLSDGDDAPSFYQIATGLHEVSVSLRTLAQLGGGREWLPIESAPRDDTVIVVIEATDRNKTFPNWRESVPVYIDESGIICDVGTGKPEIGIASGNYRATHWQPLPPAPTEPAQAGRE